MQIIEFIPTIKKALYRSKFDFLTIQFTRIASSAADGSSVLRQGRLKSAMVPLADSIAAVVKVDISLLTHRTPRKTHVKAGGAHGANRPGLNVPENLESLESYGTSASAIYELLAKSYLVITPAPNSRQIFVQDIFCQTRQILREYTLIFKQNLTQSGGK